MTTTALPGKSPTSVTLIAHDTLQAHPKHRASARVKCRIATDTRLELHTMNPVAIFRFSPDDGPGYFASFLDRHSIPWQLFKIDDGDDIPHNLSSFSGLVFMGGPMSVNDDLPWIPPILGAIRAAISRGQPCIGHCLGGQLMSKALGGLVSVNAVKEIGWNPVIAENNDIALEWLSEDFVKQSILTTFQWHGETFTLPAGATRILTGEACANQAFVVGNSLAMQCHTEMTPAMIEEWCADWAAENVKASSSVQRPEEMRHAMEKNLVALRTLADQLYSRWMTGLLQQADPTTSQDSVIPA